MHPVFDSLNFPWQFPEAHNLYLVLCQVYFVQKDIDTFYRSCGAYATEIPTINIQQAPGDLWKDVLDNLSKNARLKTLCEKLEQSGPVPQLQAALDDLKNKKSAIDPKIVDTNLLILDRKTLRENLQLLANDDHPVKVLLVRGTPKSGKTYSRHLFEAMAKQQGAGIVYLYSFVVVDLNDVLDYLFKGLGDPAVKLPPGDTTQAGWYGKVCRSLLSLARTKNKRMWIAVDDLGFTADQTTIMDPEIRDFFIQFVRQMTGPDFREYFKLMLINYPTGNLPSGWYTDHLAEENTSETDISQSHIEEIINNWCAANGKQVLQDQVTTEAAKIIANADNAASPQDRSRLEKIREAVGKLLNAL